MLGSVAFVMPSLYCRVSGLRHFVIESLLLTWDSGTHLLMKGWWRTCNELTTELMTPLSYHCNSTHDGICQSNGRLS